MEIQWSEGAVLSCAGRCGEARRQPRRGELAEAQNGREESGWRSGIRDLSAARRRGAERAEAREEFELERVVSCGNDDQRWRTKLDLGSGKPLDDLHGAITLGAAPKIGRVFGGGGVLFGLRSVAAPSR